MVICRYFLEGRCRYGNACHFEHPGEEDERSRSHGAVPEIDYDDSRYQHHVGSRVRYSSSRYSAPHGHAHREEGHGFYGHAPRFPPEQRYETPQRLTNPIPAQPASRPTTEDEILRNICADIMDMWAQTASTSQIFQPGKIWPFSCYSYTSLDGLVKTDALFGLTDFSPEELRLECLKARGNPDHEREYVGLIVTEANGRRQKFSEIVDICSKPSSHGAHSLIKEIRDQAALKEARFSAGGDRFSSQPAQSQHLLTSPLEKNDSGVPMVEGPYSDTSQLTAEEFLQFAAPEFTAGKVPYKPPPQQLC